MAVDGVTPPAHGSVLVIGEGLPVTFDSNVRVVRRMWGEVLGDEAGFERIVVLAGGNVRADFGLLMGQMWRLLRPDGLLVLVVARPSPWGVRKSVWWRGLPLARWKRWLRGANWLIADVLTVGFCAPWARWVPCGGPVRVILAQKRVAGMKILARDVRGEIKAVPAGVPV